MMSPSDWQSATSTTRLKRVQRKGFKAYRCLDGDHAGSIVKFELTGMNYWFHSIED